MPDWEMNDDWQHQAGLAAIYEALLFFDTCVKMAIGKPHL